MNLFLTSRLNTRTYFWTAATCIWISGLFITTVSLSRYANTAGQSAKASEDWPAGTQWLRDDYCPTLIMCVHPQCPCSRASINELEVLMAQCHGQLAAKVLFVVYPGLENNVMQTELWKTGSRIDGVTCVEDDRGKWSALLHAETSGQVFLYDHDGTLRFSGGITAARGHSGDNDGVSAIRAIVNKTPTEIRQTPVFGCSL